MKRAKRTHRLLTLSLLLLALPLAVTLWPAKRTLAATIVNIPDSYGPNNVVKARIYEGTWEKKDGNYRFYRSGINKMVKGRWFRNNGSVYLVGADGSRMTGWVHYRRHLYYLNKDGKMRTGWLAYKYYFKPSSGRMVLNTLYRIGSAAYLFDTAGIKQIGMHTYNGDPYFFFNNGKMAHSRWVKYNGRIYWMQESGKMLKSSWLTVSGKKYYVGSDGARVTGQQNIDGVIYFFTNSGVLRPGKTVDPSRPMIALTFDDGPSIYTPRLLACLKKNNAHATFFMVGDRVLTYPGSVQLMTQYGCELGNHSYSHSAMTSLSTSEIENEFMTTSANIYRACGRYPTVARLPYGDGYNDSRVLSAIGLPSVYWSVDTEDWANTGDSQHTISAVLNNAKSGDIILMHDLYPATANAVEIIVPALVARGFQLVTVSELARYKGGTVLSQGRTYFNFY